MPNKYKQQETAFLPADGPTYIGGISFHSFFSAPPILTQRQSPSIASQSRRGVRRTSLSHLS
jgi:hypothetical protein